MSLKNLVNKYIQTQDCEDFFKDFVDIPIPQIATDFVEKFHNKAKISQEEFAEFSIWLSSQDKQAQRCINHLMYKISHDIYLDFKDEVDQEVSTLEANLKAEGKIFKHLGDNADKYIGLLNCYLLHAQCIDRDNVYYTPNYPGVDLEAENIALYSLPFAINALRLVNKLPTTENFHGFDLSKPCYPLHLNIDKNEKVPLKKGVKNSDDYYPYKMVSKIAKGDVGDNTFLATNGEKILFIRGAGRWKRYAPEAVLASKIATIVSPDHFSSERLLDNQLVGSRGIAAYALSAAAADPKTRKDRRKYIEQNNHIFPGSGLIDETMNFLAETDPNIENFGFSSENVYESHLSKIDFDRCSFETMRKERYELDLLTRVSGIYPPDYFKDSDDDDDFVSYYNDVVQSNSSYINEKLTARLKLSMLTGPLFSKLADKAYAPNDNQKKVEAIQECIRRTDIALEKFLKHPKAESFLKETPTVVVQCLDEVKNYISTHFEDSVHKQLEDSLTRRALDVRAKIHKEFRIDCLSSAVDRLKLPAIQPEASSAKSVSNNNTNSSSLFSFFNSTNKISPQILKQQEGMLSCIRNIVPKLPAGNPVVKEIQKLLLTESNNPAKLLSDIKRATNSQLSSNNWLSSIFKICKRDLVEDAMSNMERFCQAVQKDDLNKLLYLEGELNSSLTIPSFR